MRFLSTLIFLLVVFSHGTAQQKNATVRMTPDQLAKVNALLAKGAPLERTEPQKAVQYYTEAIALAPKEAQLYIVRGFVYLSVLRNLNAADADFSRAIQFAPKLGNAYYYRGLARINMQLLTDAEADIANAIRLGFKNSEAHLNLAVTQGMLRKYPEAIDNISQAVKLSPKDNLMYYERGNLYRATGKFKEAIQDYDQALKLKPDNINAYINRASSKGMLQDYQGAANDYTYLIEKTPPNMLNYYNRGYVYFLGKQYDKALEDFSAALKIDSNAVRSNVMLIHTYNRSDRYAEAVGAATRFLKANAQDAQGFTNAGGAVQAFLKTDDFVNGEVFLARAEARKQIGDSVGACKDALKASALGYSAATMQAKNFCYTKDIFLKDESFPQNKQLYARGTNDSATISLSGVLREGGFDSAFVMIYKNGVLQKRNAIPVQYRFFMSGAKAVTQASIVLNAAIHAELTEYSLHLGLKSRLRDTIIAKVDSVVCGDVFVVGGQSNAVLGVLPQTPHNEYLRTYYFAHRDDYWGLAQANNNTDDYNVGGMALQMAERIAAEQKVPVCVINGGLSGSTIEQHFRNDSLPTSPQSWYGRTLWRMQQSGLVGAVKGIVWYQGESNQGAGYTEKFMRLYNAWKQDLTGFKNLYVVQIHPSDCGQIDHASLREEQRRFSVIFPNTTVLAAVGTPAHDGCHFGSEGYRTLGDNLYRVVARDMYKSADTIGITAPNLLKAYWKNSERTDLVLAFSTNDSLFLGLDTAIAGTTRSLTKDAFLLDGKITQCQNIRVEAGNRLVIKFSSPVNAKSVGYIPERCYGGAVEAPCKAYSGPWITTRRGVGALTFHNVPIESAP